MVVPDCISAYRAENIKQSVSIGVLHNIAQTVLQVDREVRRELARLIRQTRLELDRLGRGEARLDEGLGLAGERASAGREEPALLLGGAGAGHDLLGCGRCAGENHNSIYNRARYRKSIIERNILA